ncbi:MAG: peptidylprolyl isomerase [Flavobacteriales bacterium]|nr:peptidylprolyl isomerase [Flavobacteriales bacterium]
MKYIAKSVLICSLFAISFSISAQKKVVLDEVIGVVGNEIVTKFEVETKFNSLNQSGAVITDNSRCEVLEEVLFTKMLLNQAKVDSLEVTDDQVEAEMNRRLRHFIAQLGSEERMEEVYGESISDIKNRMRDALFENLMVQSMQGELTSDVNVTPAEVEEFYNRIPTDSLPLIDAEVEIAQIIKYAPISREAKQAAKSRLREFKERVENGEKFSTLAVLYSEDKASAVRGGEIGFVGRAEVEAEFGAAAFKLKAGQVSPIVETRYGFHILQLIERRGDRVNVRHILIRPQMDAVGLEKARSELDSIADLINEGSLTFEQAAKKFTDDEDSRNNGGLLINPYDASSMIPMDNLDPSLFLVIDNLEEGEMSEIVQLAEPGGKAGFKLVKLQKRTEPHRASLEADYQKVKSAARAEKEQEVLQEWLTRAMQETYIKLDPEYLKNCEFQQDWMQFADEDTQ